MLLICARMSFEGGPYSRKTGPKLVRSQLAEEGKAFFGKKDSTELRAIREVLGVGCDELLK